MDNLGYIDFIILALIALSAIRGFFSGFIRELFGMLGFVLGIAFASRFSTEVGQWFKIKVFDFDSQTLHTLMGFILVFLAVWAIMLFSSWIIDRLVKIAFSKYLNGLLGALFGAIKAFLIVAIILHFIFRLEFMSGVLAHVGNHCVMYPAMESIASKIAKIDLAQHIPKDSQDVEQKLNEAKEGLIDEVKNLENQMEQSMKQNLQGQ
ncbi:CvpA family protein [Helicobacter kayseriensis]|uniref:CvpA family protein n=1 Tax=Helicobacter kayseriensis TaxID=2905877 RepID=UPI001E638A5A|nr:CvpA family protein [Helicobacter kayseriensis]MCE3047497.1 CvpA family protein [Helicobacter kayseriensis]MCE3048770.1 CvpA family protein [Helicobacter kayseriensis]